MSVESPPHVMHFIDHERHRQGVVAAGFELQEGPSDPGLGGLHVVRLITDHSSEEVQGDVRPEGLQFMFLLIILIDLILSASYLFCEPP